MTKAVAQSHQDFITMDINMVKTASDYEIWGKNFQNLNQEISLTKINKLCRVVQRY